MDNFVDNNALVFKIYYGKNTINLDSIDIIEEDVKEKMNINCDILLEKDVY